MNDLSALQSRQSRSRLLLSSRKGFLELPDSVSTENATRHAASTPDIISFAAENVNNKNIIIDASKGPYFFGDGEVLRVPSAQNVTLLCNGTALQSDAETSFFVLSEGATLTFVHCTLNIPNLMATLIRRTFNPSVISMDPPPISAPPPATQVARRRSLKQAQDSPPPPPPPVWAQGPVRLTNESNYAGMFEGNASVIYEGGSSIQLTCHDLETLDYICRSLRSDSSLHWKKLDNGHYVASRTILVAGSSLRYDGTTMFCISDQNSTEATAHPPARHKLAFLSLLLLIVPMVAVLLLLRWWHRRRQSRLKPSHMVAKAESRGEGSAAGSVNAPGGQCWPFSLSSPSRPADPDLGLNPSTQHSIATDETASSDAPAAHSIVRAIRQLKSDLADKHLHILAPIASGGFGRVYQGTWRGIPVAIKTVVFPDVESGGRSIERAASEAAIAFNLSHPNIVTTYAHELMRLANPLHLTEWKLYLIQELCNGGSLADMFQAKCLLHRDEQVHLRRIVSILLDVAMAMAHVHSKRITHADLTPSNVLLHIPRQTYDAGSTPNAVARRAVHALDEGRCCVKVADFGLSIRLQAGRSHISNVCRGTAYYCAPEVLFRRQLSPASDVYSFGVIMWQLLENRLPYVYVNAMTQGNPLFPALSGHVPHCLQRLTKICLDEDPARRPAFTCIVGELTSVLQEFSGAAETSHTETEGVSPPHMGEEQGHTHAVGPIMSIASSGLDHLGSSGTATITNPLFQLSAASPAASECAQPLYDRASSASSACYEDFSPTSAT